MAVSNQTIIQKMITELNNAKNKVGSSQEFKQHIASVKLLCELILDEPQESTSSTNEVISDQEMKAMLGDLKNQHNQQKGSQPSYTEEKGDSIFDF